MDSESVVGSEFSQKIGVSGELEIDKTVLEFPTFINQERIKKWVKSLKKFKIDFIKNKFKISSAQKMFQRNFFSMMSSMYFGLSQFHRY